MTFRGFAYAAAVLLAALITPFTATSAPPELGAGFGDEITRAAFFKPGIAPVRQTGPHDVTIVYFMDYQCPACRKHTPDVARAFKEDRRLRVIYRDTPIFGPRSEAAARAAIASHFQGKHEAMHLALMQSPMPLDEQALKAAASKAGVDWGSLQRDLKERSDEIDLQIARNQELSRAAGIAGTPAFIVGNYLANGVLDYEGMKGTIADARKEAGISPSSLSEAVANPRPEDRRQEEEGDPRKDPDTVQLDRDPGPGDVAFEEPSPTIRPVQSTSAEVSPVERARPLWPWLLALGLTLAAAVVARSGLLRRPQRAEPALGPCRDGFRPKGTLDDFRELGSHAQLDKGDTG